MLRKFFKFFFSRLLTRIRYLKILLDGILRPIGFLMQNQNTEVSVLLFIAIVKNCFERIQNDDNSKIAVFLVMK